MDEMAREILALTERLLEAIRLRDWPTYEALCDPSLTCFEPETAGDLVEGLPFHRFYFDLGGHLGPHANTIVAPRIRSLGENAALIAYVRLIQHADADGRAETRRVSETRLWQRHGGVWKHVHFHRS